MGLDPKAKAAAKLWAAGMAPGTLVAAALLLLDLGMMPETPVAAVVAVGLAAAGVMGGVLAVVIAVVEKKERSLTGGRLWAAERSLTRITRTNLLSFDEIERFTGEAEGVRVNLIPGDRGSTLWVGAPLGAGEEVDIRRREPGEGGGLPTGNPVLDPLVVVRKAPAAVAARLADPANLPAAMQVVHGYKSWSIAGSGEVAIWLDLDEGADERAVERAFRAASALARLLAGGAERP